MIFLTKYNLQKKGMLLLLVTFFSVITMYGQIENAVPITNDTIVAPVYNIEEEIQDSIVSNDDAIIIPNDTNVDLPDSIISPVEITESDQISPDSSDVLLNAIPNEKPQAKNTNGSPSIIKKDSLISRPPVQNGLVIYATRSEIIFKKNEIISNVLCVVNVSDKKISFVTDISAPSSWQPFSSKNRVWEVESGDSVYVPIRVVPQSGSTGSSRFMFSVFLYTPDDDFLGYTMFSAFTERQLKWELNVSDSKIYLLNNDNKVPFSVSLFNQGPEQQTIQLQMIGLSQNFLITDSLSVDITRRPITVSLESYQDTTFHMLFYEKAYMKNSRHIDLDNYNPFRQIESQKFQVFFRSVSPTPSEIGRYQSSKKIEFARLSNDLEVNRYGSDVLPLEVDMNIHSLFGNQPVMNVFMRGNTEFSNESMLSYMVQSYFDNNSLSLNPLLNSSYFLGYYHEKFDVQFGNVYGGIPGVSFARGGKGIKGRYFIDRQNSIGLFYTQGPTLFKSPEYFSTGFSYNHRSRLLNINTTNGHFRNTNTNQQSNVGTLSIGTSIVPNHNFTLNMGVSQNYLSDTTSTNYGFFAGGSIGGHYLKNRLSTRIYGMYYSPLYAGSGIERYNGNFLTSYNHFNRWRLVYRSMYNNRKYTNLSNYENISNTLTFQNKILRNLNFTPNVFYNIMKNNDFVVHSRGLGLGFGRYDMTTSSRAFVNVNFGYNRAISLENIDRFFLQTGGMFQFRTWSLIARYSIGNVVFSRNMYLLQVNSNPQTVNVSLRNQYETPFKGLVLQNQVSYNYATFAGHTVNLVPEIYLYTASEWRFRLFAEYSVYRRANAEDVFYMTSADELQAPEWNSGFNLGFGIRKEFGVPIPFVENDYASVECMAFYDVNGNGKRDKDEQVLENIVVRINGFEAITDKNGICNFINVPKAVYEWKTFSLEYINGWFPYVEDSVSIYQSGTLYVPYTRGVKVSGKVFIDREQWSAFGDIEIDLSRIKITAVNHKVYNTLTDKNADFSFYLPKGKYVISMDEKILGGRFQLLQNNFEFEVDDSFDNLFVPFYIVEKKRNVRIKRF